MISTLTGSSSSKIIKKWTTTVPYVTGYDIATGAAYSVTYGKVVYIGQEPDGTFTVNIKCNDDEVLRYGNLTSLLVSSSNEVSAGTKLGNVARFVHFEYATRWQGNSRMPVRVNQYLYFKQDPSDILEGKYMPKRQPTLEYAPSRNITIVTYDSDEQEYEFKGKVNV